VEIEEVAALEEEEANLAETTTVEVVGALEEKRVDLEVRIAKEVVKEKMASFRTYLCTSKYICRTFKISGPALQILDF